MNKKPYCNEKGVTLIELLLALMLAGIVIGVLTMTFMSINQEWNRSTNKYNDDMQARKTVNLLNDYLTDSLEVFSTVDEIRFRTGNGKLKTLKYENEQVILYDYEAPSLEEVGNYLNPFVLATNVQAPPIIIYANQPQYLGSIRGGELFQLQIIFEYRQTDINGNMQTVSRPYIISVKLFK